MDKRVAIIGTSFRFPGTTPRDFWNDLLANKDLVSHVEEGRWSFDAYTHPDKKHPATSYTFKAGSIGDVSGFDAAFFGISPREASLMDPQQRLLLEMSWEAIEHAGVAPSRLKGSQCGVYIGIASADYAYRFTEDLSIVDSSVATGNTASIAANRISYLFDLHGPSIAMDTACSSSLVAFHQACQAIRSGETEQALAGGVSLHLHPYGFIAFSKATMLSPKGRCQVFDADGDGYVRSEGGGIFYLKDLDAAVRDGDRILAVVAGSGVNTDGYKSGLTVPNPNAQMELMSATYAKAGLTADDLDYLEAHGTGTSVGDPIETRAIGLALGQKRQSPLPIGSIKSNVGHLEAASGVAGLAKALYAIRYREVPATISMKTPNPNIQFSDWNIEVVSENRPLPKDKPLTVGLNSFGFGGANAHVILQSPPSDSLTQNQLTDSVASNEPLPLVVSARDTHALQEALAQLVELLGDDSIALYDLAYNLLERRERHSQALVLWAKTKEEALALIEAKLDQGIAPLYLDKPSSDVAFVYSGNGCQWETMGKTLLETSSSFRQAVTEVDRYFTPLAGFSLVDELQGLNGKDRFVQTEIAQPALFALQVGITALLKEHHVTPVAVTGHSVGEVASAWASGALTLEEAVSVIYHRSQSQGETAGNGEMTAVGLGEPDMLDIIESLGCDQVELAGVNSVKGTTLAGNPDQLSLIEARLAEDGTFHRRLSLNYAFHSSAMDPIELGIKQSLSALAPKATTIPFYSTVAGGVTDGTQLGANYWWDNIRQPVQFLSAIDALIQQGITHFVEIGAHPVLKSYLNDQLKAANLEGTVLSTMTRRDATLNAIEASASTALLTLPTKPGTLLPVTGRFVELPDYPWQRESLWHPTTAESLGMLERTLTHPLLGFPVKQIDNTWENTLDTHQMPWLADHKVGENVVFPGTGYVEILRAAASEYSDAGILELEELEIKQPILLDEDSCKKLRVQYTPETGKVTLQSRELVTGEQWTPNANARALKMATGLYLSAQAPVIPERAPDFDQVKHLEYTAKAGLDYGRAFQTLDAGWADEHTVIARMAPDYDTQGLGVHPAQLDCTFQLIIHFMLDRLNAEQGIAYVPTRIGRLFIQQGALKPSVVRAKLIKRAPHSITAEFDWFSDDGEHILSVKEARFRAVRVKKNAQQHVDFLDYQLTPISPVATATDSAWATLLGKDLKGDLNQRSRVLTEEFDPLCDALITAYLRETLGQHAQDGVIDAQRIDQWKQQQDEGARFIEALLRFAEARGVVESEGQQYRVYQEEDAIPADDIWQMMARDYPDYFAMTHLVGRFGLHLNALLSGDRSAFSVEIESLYPQLLAHRSNSALRAHLGQQVARFLEEQATPTARRRVLEVGVFEPAILPVSAAKFDFAQQDLAFASLDGDALLRAEHLQESYPLMDVFSLLDDNEQARTFDTVIIHIDGVALDSMGQLLRHLSVFTAEGANVLFIAPQYTDWLEAVLSVDPKWTVDADTHTTQQITPKAWITLLEQSGFSHVHLAHTAVDHSQFWLTASAIGSASAETAPEGSWLLLGPSSDLSKSILASAGAQLKIQHIESDYASLADHSTESWIETVSNAHADRIILLPETASSSFDEAVFQQLSNRCKAVNHLYKALEGAGLEQTVVVVTEGVAGIYQGGSSTLSHDSAVWGFTRTLMNETVKAAFRLVDVASGHTSEATIHTLLNVCGSASNEAEVFINADGLCFAPRLRVTDESAWVEINDTTDQAENVFLGFDMPGQLKNLKWFAQNDTPLEAGQLRVDVKATGLNFRDVMYTLGLLSDEAIENGFAGPTLGLEFSGVVTEVAEGVEGYAIGDAVVGFGPASFSRRVITTPNAISHIPEGISFEAASTIPSTFFTVYYALHYLGRLEPGEKILIHGAAGGVGIAAIQVARWIGAEIYATAGSDSKRDFLKMMGVDHIYDSRSLTYAEEILFETGGRGVDVVLNSLAGEAINQNLRVLKPFGRFLELGKRDFYENTHIGLRPFRNNISYFGIDADQLMQEKPVLTHRLFTEMMGLFADGTLYPLPYTRFDATHIVDAFRYMQQAKQIGKIVVGYDQPLEASSKSKKVDEQALTLNPDATYLVTGGLGGFGLKTAQWLVEKGARHLALLSRRGASSEEATEALAHFKSSGINAQAFACDVTDKAALSGTLATIKDTMPTLKGVVHAAALIEDSLALNLEDDQLERVLRTKIMGAQWLDELTENLDLFVLYSSATTLLGNPGQTCYVAANHWLEALAANRQARGEAATCPRWGAIDDVGFLARNEKIKDALQSRIGGQALPSKKALDALEKMIVHGIVQQGVL
jgi:phthiocerol/phenolphthiocerol synthesis type-I polyketide synthase C